MISPARDELDPLAIALAVGGALDALGIAFHLGGSLASSVHGFARATLDADLVAALRPGDGRALAARLHGDYYADALAMETAIAERRSFNVIHVPSMIKVDVFVAKDTPFDRECFARCREHRLGEAGVVVRVATAEDTVLHKLVWFEKGGRVSERQWGDVVGVLEVQAGRLDLRYLRRWARDLDVETLLEGALSEAAGRLGDGDAWPL